MHGKMVPMLASFQKTGRKKRTPTDTRWRGSKRGRQKDLGENERDIARRLSGQQASGWAYLSRELERSFRSTYDTMTWMICKHLSLFGNTNNQIIETRTGAILHQTSSRGTMKKAKTCAGSVVVRLGGSLAS